MGAAQSSAEAALAAQDAPFAEVCVPLSIRSSRTTVWQLGSLDSNCTAATAAAASGGTPTTSSAAASGRAASGNLCTPAAAATAAPSPPAPADDELYWHTVGGKRAFPVPPGYRATCTTYGQECTLTVESALDAPSPAAGASTHLPVVVRRRPRFVLTAADGSTHSGASPSAPLAKLALELGQPAVLNGLEAFGLLSPHVQRALRAAAAAAGLLQDEPPAARQPTTEADPRSAAAPPPPPAKQPAGGRPPLPRSVAAPPPLTFLSPFASPSAQRLPAPPCSEQQQPAPPPSRSGRRKPAPAAEAAAAAAAAGGDGGSCGLEEDVAALVARPASRAQRRRAGSAGGGGGGGRAWTAFTCFGLKQREGLRAAHPGLGHKDVERLLGQQWAALPAGDKQLYADLAARVRSAQGGGGGDNGISLQRSASEPDAAPEQRPQRPARPNSLYGRDMYDTSQDADGEEGGAAGAGGEAGSDSEGDGAATRRLSLKRSRSAPAGSSASTSAPAKRGRKAAAPRPAAAGEVLPGAALSGCLLELLEAADSAELLG